MSERTHKRLNVLLVVCCAPSARDKKPLSEISVLFIHSPRWRERKKKKKKPFMCLFLRALSTWCAATTAPAYSLIFFLSFFFAERHSCQSECRVNKIVTAHSPSYLLVNVYPGILCSHAQQKQFNANTMTILTSPILRHRS